MRYGLVLVLLTALFITACQTKHIRIGGMVCPEGHTEQMVQRDLSQCRYYDAKAAAEASKSKIAPECIECLKKRGYEIEE